MDRYYPKPCFHPIRSCLSQERRRNSVPVHQANPALGTPPTVIELTSFLLGRQELWTDLSSWALIRSRSAKARTLVTRLQDQTPKPATRDTRRQRGRRAHNESQNLQKRSNADLCHACDQSRER